MSVKDGKVDNFELVGNIGNTDRTLSPYIDNLTTVNGLFKYQSEKIIYQDNTVEGIERFPSVILEKIEGKSTKNYDMSLHSELAGDETLITYRARVPAIHGMLPIPKKYGQDATEKDKKILELYPEISADPAAVSAIPGDYVYVGFRDLNTFSGGEIQSNVNGISVSNMNSSTYSTSEQSSAGEAYKSLSPVAVQGKKILLIGDSHTYGGYGQELQKLIDKQNTCFRVARGGWHSRGYFIALGVKSAKNWSNDGIYLGEPKKKQRKIDTNILKQVFYDSYDVCIVGLGTNDVVSHGGNRNGYISQCESNIDFLSHLSSHGKKTKLIFVGPPALRKASDGLVLANNQKNNWYPPKWGGAQKMVQDATNIDAKRGNFAALDNYVAEMKRRCSANGIVFIDSVKHTSKAALNSPTNPDVHYWGPAAIEWANGVWSEISRVI